MTLIRNPSGSQWLIMTVVLLALLAQAPPTARALPPPLSPEELQQRADLVIEGRVTKVWLYSEWLTFLRHGGMGAAAQTLLKQAPATDAELLRLIRNFPYKSGVPLKVAVDSSHLAEVQVAKTLKGQPEKVIFIPFLRYHFLTGPSLEGPWTERTYHVGEHLRLYLRQNGPFFESTYWNAVRLLDK